jgi:hypothetical protein
MLSFLKSQMGRISRQEFLDHFGFAVTCWMLAYRPDTTKCEYTGPRQGLSGFLEPKRVCNNQ